MNTKEAKDFFVERTAEQAALESVPLSELEKRMMYFTESDPASCPNPLELNDEFEGQYDTPEYEAKIARLLHGAYKRLKAEAPQKARDWDDAVRTLRKGDHYLLVFWSLKPSGENRWRDNLIMIGIGLLIVAGIVIWDFWLAK
ncbi:MAG: hypothetical protein ACLP3K_18665 [Candidatus Acidiferrales bacterium]